MFLNGITDKITLLKINSRFISPLEIFILEPLINCVAIYTKIYKLKKRKRSVSSPRDWNWHLEALVSGLGRDYFRTLVLFIGAAFLVPAKLHVRPSIILRLYSDTLENASRYRRKSRSPPSHVSCLLFIASYPMHRVASHRNGDARSNSSETAPSGVRPPLRSNSRPTTGGSISKSTSILYFHATTSPRRVYTSAVFRGDGPKMLAQSAPWCASSNLSEFPIRDFITEMLNVEYLKSVCARDIAFLSKIFCVKRNAFSLALSHARKKVFTQSCEFCHPVYASDLLLFLLRILNFLPATRSHRGRLNCSFALMHLISFNRLLWETSSTKWCSLFSTGILCVYDRISNMFVLYSRS